MRLDHPNEPGRWTLLERSEHAALWRRDRVDPFPVSQFYLIAPPSQAQLVYVEAQARERYAQLVAGSAG